MKWSRGSMPYAYCRGFKIHYQVEGEGQPLVLYHWSLSFLDSWYELSYVDKLKSNYKLILVDALGHGKSDTPHGLEHYTLKQRVDDLLSVLDDANIETSHFYGFSMGGWVGYGLAIYAPERFRSIMIGGAQCFEQSMQGLRDILSSGIENGMDAFLLDYESIFGEQTPAHKKIIRQFDLHALLDVAQDRESLSESIPLMPGSKMLFLVGENDSTLEGIQKCHQKLPGSTLVTLPGLDHGGLCNSTDMVVSYIDRFIEDRVNS
jgi:pimeloyl-ACP methyl ester carboxylesterase